MEDSKKTLNFIEEIIEEDIRNGKHGGRVHTRFPPEPNGYLHIGHAKAICLNFGLAVKYKGKANLRFDDTNPVTEDTEYVEAIKTDIRWLGFDWEDREYYASDYFERLYQFALQLIDTGKAYVDDSSSEEIAAMKKGPTEPGIESPYRNRSADENHQLFLRMRAGEFPEGSKVLRAKIDMTSPNMHLRDPLLYRILYKEHHRTGNKWCIYPMYDFAHGQCDSIEGITHSICTLEFENHKPLYNWFIRELGIFPSQQYEFARLNLSYTVMSKRKLLKIVNEGLVEGWDDPRMPTIAAFRRKGYTPASIRNFASLVGVAKRDNVIDLSLLEHSVREDLNKIALRMMVVKDPLPVTLTDYKLNGELVEIENNPEDESQGTRPVTFSRNLLIEREDFMEDAPSNFFRLKPGGMVRLKGAYIILCNEVVKDAHGRILELKCSHIPESRSGNDHSGIKVKSTIHWVDAGTSIDVELKLYDRLFRVEDPNGEDDFMQFINPESLEIVKYARAEAALQKPDPGKHYQFVRLGYFKLDHGFRDGVPVFNRTVTLKDGWAKSKHKSN
ncbi:MAG: glutamine--tRNA ligase/YqeY domain fusion protein [Saprospiraceae bacterium]|jgi:glutaminyl-tRNA synthetase|nr:glutamine--tRNA ligase/YqeY domain fusion protein [Saprospiraceae bacterium]MBP9209674.1 glutamine--tRNA ligase/YqeY domain fusion protein [Saprospiraceae bacterium]MBV6471965.1 Glutamine--tRNA ligase [Saprospiraceae bacterium]